MGPRGRRPGPTPTDSGTANTLRQRGADDTTARVLTRRRRRARRKPVVPGSRGKALPLFTSPRLPGLAASTVAMLEEVARPFEDESRAMLERLDASSSEDAADAVFRRAPEVYRLDVYRAIRARVPGAPWLAGMLLNAWYRTDALGLTPHPAWTPAEHLAEFRTEFLAERERLGVTLAPLTRTGTLALYRGTSEGDDIGRARSWTLRREVAELFRGRVGRRHRDGGRVLVLDIPAAAVHAGALFFTDARKEAEVYFADDPRGWVESRRHGITDALDGLTEGWSS